jgi:homoserine dehydrogenase
LVRQVGIGICGLGTVGSGTFNLIRSSADEITRKTGVELVIQHVGCRRDHPDCDLSGVKVSRDIFEVAKDPEVDVLLELIGGTDTAKELVTSALENGKHVVTANKALIALEGMPVMELAKQKGVALKFEAAIAGGIPIVKALTEGLAGNQVEYVAGIINGTTNYILTEMEGAGNRDFADVLAEAQALGYAEADPTFDVEGIDAAHKLTLLTSMAFGTPPNFEAMYTEGISEITSADIKYAAELGYRIKHLGIARKTDSGIEQRVHPTLIRHDALLAQVNGVMNAVLVGSDAAGETMYMGAGAGAGPTASSVLTDVISIVNGDTGCGLGFQLDALRDEVTMAIGEVSSAYYLRLNALDQPGVLAKISTILSNHEISIEALIQKDVSAGEVPIVIITNEVKEQSLNDALAKLESMADVKGRVVRIRVASF